MISALPIRIKWGGMDIFKGIENILYAEDADIQIMEWPSSYENYDKDKYKIMFCREVMAEMVRGANTVSEVWVESLEDKIVLQKVGLIVPVIVLSEDKKLLPYCMKDRLAYLQDKINKEKGR